VAQVSHACILGVYATHFKIFRHTRRIFLVNWAPAENSCY